MTQKELRDILGENGWKIRIRDDKEGQITSAEKIGNGSLRSIYAHYDSICKRDEIYYRAQRYTKSRNIYGPELRIDALLNDLSIKEGALVSKTKMGEIKIYIN